MTPICFVLYTTGTRALWSYVVGLNGGDRANAQDVVQETMPRTWRNDAVLEPADGAQRGWMFAVARHIVIDEWRSSRRHSEVVTDQVSEPPARLRRSNMPVLSPLAIDASRHWQRTVRR